MHSVGLIARSYRLDEAAEVPDLSEGAARWHGAGTLDSSLTGALEELVPHAAEANAFAEPWFLGASLAYLAQDSSIRLLEIQAQGRLIGLLPLHVAGRYGRMPVRHVQNWRHHHQFLGTPLVRAGFEQAFWNAAIEALDVAQWAPNFLHINGLVEHGPVHQALVRAAAGLGRGAPTVHRAVRALLASDADAETYYREAVRPKKRKEIGRLVRRFAELGPVDIRHFGTDDALDEWADIFLALEKAGWKGQAGSALACNADTDAFFRAALAGALGAGRLDMIRLDLAGAPVAMLVNFLSPPGSFSFKTAFDERYARFSPGILVQRENLAILSNPEIAWMDSCAEENHPMIDSLWRERRAIVRVTVPLAGARRRLVHAACRALETASALTRAILKDAKP